MQTWPTLQGFVFDGSSARGQNPVCPSTQCSASQPKSAAWRHVGPGAERNPFVCAAPGTSACVSHARPEPRTRGSRGRQVKRCSSSTGERECSHIAAERRRLRFAGGDHGSLQGQHSAAPVPGQSPAPLPPLAALTACNAAHHWPLPNNRLGCPDRPLIRAPPCTCARACVLRPACQGQSTHRAAFVPRQPHRAKLVRPVAAPLATTAAGFARVKAAAEVHTRDTAIQAIARKNIQSTAPTALCGLSSSSAPNHRASSLEPSDPSASFHESSRVPRPGARLPRRARPAAGAIAAPVAWRLVQHV